MTTTVTISGSNKDLFDELREQITDDALDDVIDAEVATRGRRAGEVTSEEALRVAAEAYLGELDVSLDHDQPTNDHSPE